MNTPVLHEEIVNRMLDCEYHCVRCVTSLECSEGVLHCAKCGHTYPITQGIPILTLRPNTLLAYHHQKMFEARTRVQSSHASFLQDRCIEPRTSSLADRWRRILRGLDENLSLFERCMAPIAEYVAGIGQGELTLCDSLSIYDAGWSPDVILPYFYQDWGGTEDFEKVRRLLTDAATQYSPDQSVVAVLGAGACGVAHQLASQFAKVYAIDLSVPALSLSKRVLSGEGIQIHLEPAGWHPVQLAGASIPRRNLRLAVADVNGLPLASESLSAVVTQYLMDIVGNPLNVAAEIQRVLRAGGIWINFSVPFRLRAEPAEFGPIGIDELPQVLEPLGYRLVDAHYESFTLLNLERVAPHATKLTPTTHFFIAVKDSGTRCRSSTFSAREMLPGRSSEWWMRVPRLAPGQMASVTSSTVFTATGVEQRAAIVLGRGSLAVSEDNAAQLRTVLSLVDGRRSIRDIYNRLVAQGSDLSEEEFGELLYYLVNRQGVVI